MKAPSVKPVRCAIYTRVSTEHGLDQEFNSLDAQYEAATAYIKSQAHAGWTPLRSRYDDGGYSGGSTDRPDLQRLLEDVRSGKIDVIVVYKVDRLTRSLADFAKLVELFDANDVSFVSVTQAFNTTTSMGRLTLNVLLSFAQFEREVTSERIRDKIAASKRKGLWVGGNLPLGYELKDDKLVIVEREAELVRTIYRLYLDLGSVNAVVGDLKARNLTTKVQQLKTGLVRGGIPFRRGTVYHILGNRFYIGEVKYRDEILPGEQPPLMNRALFDAVREKAAEQWSHRTVTRAKSDHLLMSLLFDDAGFRMVPTHVKKREVQYRYYVSTPLLHGEAKTASAGSVTRVPATEVEGLVVKALREHFGGRHQVGGKNQGSAFKGIELDSQRSLAEVITSVTVHEDRLVVELKPNDGASEADAPPETLIIPWQKPPMKRSRDILVPASQARGKAAGEVRPQEFERRANIVSAIARGRRWLDDLVSGRNTNAAELSTREGCTVRQVNLTVSLAFLAPELVKAAMEGRLPRGIGIQKLRDLPAEWSAQFEALGLAPAAMFER